jgi:hypothetical protein
MCHPLLASGDPICAARAIGQSDNSGLGRAIFVPDDPGVDPVHRSAPPLRKSDTGHGDRQEFVAPPPGGASRLTASDRSTETVSLRGTVPGLLGRLDGLARRVPISSTAAHGARSKCVDRAAVSLSYAQSVSERRSLRQTDCAPMAISLACWLAAVSCCGRDPRRHGANRSCIILTARSGQISPDLIDHIDGARWATGAGCALPARGWV